MSKSNESSSDPQFHHDGRTPRPRFLPISVRSILFDRPCTTNIVCLTPCFVLLFLIVGLISQRTV